MSGGDSTHGFLATFELAVPWGLGALTLGGRAVTALRWAGSLHLHLGEF